MSQAHHLPVSRSERRWVWIFALVVMSVTMLPYLLGYSVQGEDHRFTGFVFGVEDGNSYIAKMVSGSYGAWLFRTPYTAYPQRGVLMFLPYILLGKLAAPPGLHVQLVVLNQLFRFVGGVLMILASYDFLAFYLSDIRLRRLGTALCALGGGLGWLLILTGQEKWLGTLPLEFYSPETFGFLGLFGIAHVAFARALLLWTLLHYLRVVRYGIESGSSLRQGAKAGLLWLLAGLMQPLVALVIGFVIVLHLSGMAVWTFWYARKEHSTDWSRWQGVVRFVIVAGIIPGLFVLYQVWSLASDPFLQLWTGQNVLPSPNPLHYLLAYGLLLPFAWLGGRYLLRTDPWTGWLPVGWFLALPVLAYLPVSTQRRLPEGIWVVLVVMALSAFERSAGRLPELGRVQEWSKEKLFATLPLYLAFPSTLIIFAIGLLATQANEPPVFRPVDEVMAFFALADSSNVGEIVLAAYDTGNVLPAWAPLRVVVGHGPESADLADVNPKIMAFFTSSVTDEARLELINQFDVRYVFWGPAERALGDWNPENADYLEPLEEVGPYSIFRVAP